MTSLSLKGNLIQYFSDDSEESHDVTLALDQMRGRINLSVLSRERWLIVRFDGWPEVRMIKTRDVLMFVTSFYVCDVTITDPS